MTTKDNRNFEQFDDDDGLQLRRLFYYSTEDVMDFSPKNYIPLSWTTLVSELAAGNARYVHLEPGDATAYHLYLIPQWNQRYTVDTLSYDDRKRYIALCYINKESCQLVAFSRDANEVFYSMEFDNQWSHLLLTSFILNLADAVYKYLKDMGLNQDAEVLGFAL